MPTIVIKPSQNIKTLPQYHQILSSQIAIGFYASKARALQCNDIIITDGTNYQQAKVTGITERICPSAKNPLVMIKRIDITFGQPSAPSPYNLSIAKAIKWSNRNIRFI